MFTTSAQELTSLHESAVGKTLDKHFNTLVQKMDGELRAAAHDMQTGKVVDRVSLYVDLPVSFADKKVLAKRLADALKAEGFNACFEETAAYNDGPGHSNPDMVHVVVRFA
jgi:hypothetical protein